MTIAIQTPDWVKHAVFYQIFPDRFAQGQHPHQSSWRGSLESWHSPPTNQGYKGGDLWGVLEKLDYLQDLGITALYFTPIFQSACNHRYHTHDYYQIAPLLGGDAAFRALRQATQARGIKLVLDGVFNHASRGFFYFNDILENGPHSPWLDWFKIKKWPLSAYDGEYPANYESWVGNRALPQFNHDNPDVREYIMQVGEYWLRQGIDGWRLDVPFEVTTPGFWQEFRQRVKAINPEAYIVGEVWRDSRQWLDGTQFDGVMNYLFTGPTLAFVGGDRIDPAVVELPDYDVYPPIDAAQYAAKMEALIALYPWDIELTQLNLLDSHDTPRALTVLGEDSQAFHLATLLMFTFPGAPCIYYGNEVGLSGAMDPDCRRVFPEPSEWNRELLAQHQDLIALRDRCPALRTGDYRVVQASGSLYAFTRSLGPAQVFIAVNVGRDPISCDRPTTMQNWPVVYGSPQAEDQITLPPQSACILTNQP